MIDFFQDLYSHFLILDPDRIPAAMAAWLLAGIAGMTTGPVFGNANPFLWIVLDKSFGRIGARLDRRERSAADLLFRGFIIAVMGAVAAFGLGLFAARLVLLWPLGGATEIILLSFALTGGAVWFALLRLYFAMRDQTAGKGAYYAIARSTRIDLSGGDDFGVTRAGIGLAARSFDKGLVAPLLWYLLAGLPGAYLYAGLAALAWRFGRDGWTSGFGKTALALERLMGFVPHILSGTVMALAGLFTPTGGMTRALIGQAFGKGRAPYDEGGLPLTATAYALNISLGGAAVDLDGHSMKRAWTGPDGATARLEKGHLRRGLYLSLMAHLLFMAALVGALLWGNLLF